MANKNDTIYYVKETWKNETGSLMQAILYRYNDDRDKLNARSLLNDTMTELVRTVYLNEKMEIIPTNEKTTNED